jgi:uncharacterized SAM-binding protein YcdF (DUF218 family)
MSPTIGHHSELPLTTEQVLALTRIVFLDPVDPVPCDLIFIFGGTHPGAWEAGAEAYFNGLGQQIFVVGGIPRNPKAPHVSWTGEDRFVPNCRRIATNLIRLGVPEHVISCDERPLNSYEEAMCLRAFIGTHPEIVSVLFISKGWGIGRQFRTLHHNLPGDIVLVPYPFETNLGEGEAVTRENWADSPQGRAMVIAEYNRILTYGKQGGLTPLASPVVGLEDIRLSHL